MENFFIYMKKTVWLFQTSLENDELRDHDSRITLPIVTLRGWCPLLQEYAVIGG